MPTITLRSRCSSRRRTASAARSRRRPARQTCGEHDTCPPSRACRARSRPMSMPVEHAAAAPSRSPAWASASAITGRLVPSCGFVARLGVEQLDELAQARRGARRRQSCGRRPRCRSRRPARACPISYVRMISAWVSSSAVGELRPHASQRDAKCGRAAGAAPRPARRAAGSRAGVVDVARLEQVVDAPVQAERLQLALAELRAARSSSSRRSARSRSSRCRAAEQRGVAAPRARRRAPAGRRGGGPSPAPAALSASHALALRRANCSASTSRARSRTASGARRSPELERLLEQRDRPRGRSRPPARSGRATRARPRPAPRAAPARGRARRPRRTSRGGRARRRATPRRRAPSSSAQRRGASSAQALQRAPVVLGRLLVGERGGRLLGRLHASSRRPCPRGRVAALEEVVGELGGRGAAASSSASPIRWCRRTRRLVLWRS